MSAGTLNCPMCGAATATDATRCQYCDAQLQTVACPSCFSLMFIGSKHCAQCGTPLARKEKPDARPHRCPHCQVEMTSLEVGSEAILECPKCAGLWVDVASLERICAAREQQAAALGIVLPEPRETGTGKRNISVRYVPCPECSKLMNRVRFARSSVVVDICKGHGTWFDRAELQRIIEFIRAGGLDESRAKEKQELADERRLRRQTESKLTGFPHPHPRPLDHERRTGVIAVADELLKFLLN
jgi:Zn-finger nucleic acid-binding protein